MLESLAGGKRDVRAEPELVRALGVRQLTASIVNVTIGAGIFVLPAAVAASLGAAAPAAYLVCALAIGTLGGLLPAIRAARLPVTLALRAA